MLIICLTSVYLPKIDFNIEWLITKLQINIHIHVPCTPFYSFQSCTLSSQSTFWVQWINKTCLVYKLHLLRCEGLLISITFWLCKSKNACETSFNRHLFRNENFFIIFVVANVILKMYHVKTPYNFSEKK